MTNPSHTELAARKLWETIKILGFQNEKFALQAIAAALESPERGVGEAVAELSIEADETTGNPRHFLRCTYDGLTLPVGEYRLFSTPPTAPAQDSQGWIEALKLQMEASAWQGVVQLEDAIANIDDAAREFPALRASSPAEQRPPYCGSGHCSCIECFYEKVPLTERQKREIIDRAGDITDGLNQDDFADEIVKLTEAAHGIVTKEST